MTTFFNNSWWGNESLCSCSRMWTNIMHVAAMYNNKDDQNKDYNQEYNETYYQPSPLLEFSNFFFEPFPIPPPLPTKNFFAEIGVE